MGEKEQTKIFIWPLRGVSKVPQDIRIQPAIFSSPGFRKNELLAKFSIRLHHIQALRVLICYQHTPTYILSKMGEKERTKIFIWPLWGRQKYPKILEFSPQIFLSPGFFPKISF